MSGHGSHDILMLMTAFKAPNWLNTKWIYVTKKSPLGKWLTQAGKDKEFFFKSQNQQLPTRISYKVPLFVLNDFHSYHRIEFDVMRSV